MDIGLFFDNEIVNGNYSDLVPRVIFVPIKDLNYINNTYTERSKNISLPLLKNYINKLEKSNNSNDKNSATLLKKIYEKRTKKNFNQISQQNLLNLNVNMSLNPIHSKEYNFNVYLKQQLERFDHESGGMSIDLINNVSKFINSKLYNLNTKILIFDYDKTLTITDRFLTFDPYISNQSNNLNNHNINRFLHPFWKLSNELDIENIPAKYIQSLFGGKKRCNALKNLYNSAIANNVQLVILTNNPIVINDKQVDMLKEKIENIKEKKEITINNKEILKFRNHVTPGSNLISKTLKTIGFNIEPKDIFFNLENNKYATIEKIIIPYYGLYDLKKSIEPSISNQIEKMFDN